MMSKVMNYILPITLLVFFILVMNSGDFLKQPRGSQDNVIHYLNQVENEIKQQEWDTALQEHQNLSAAWDKIVPRIQFSVEKAEINKVNVNLARLKVFIEVNDHNAARAEISEIREHWDNLNK
ncbi:MAG: DUF4363 family protein [Syntrophomonadaceae bacterium]|nr:DUF4363 family protein [Syntrophomonadaceae bacterium]